MQLEILRQALAAAAGFCEQRLTPFNGIVGCCEKLWSWGPE